MSDTFVDFNFSSKTFLKNNSNYIEPILFHSKKKKTKFPSYPTCLQFNKIILHFTILFFMEHVVSITLNILEL